jgi:hypothetical protein
MNVVALSMNLLLAGLLVSAMIVGIRLNRRLKALRDSHAGFEAAVRELNVAAARAERGLADLRSAADEVTDLLSDRIEKGRVLATRLETLTSAAAELPRPAAPARPVMRPPAATPAPADGAHDRLGKLIAMARSRLEADSGPRPSLQAEPLVGRSSLQGRRITSNLDDDLFEEEAPLDLNHRVGIGR